MTNPSRGGIKIDTILEFLLKKEGGFQHLALLIYSDRVVDCVVVNGALDDDIDGLIIWAKYVFLYVFDYLPPRRSRLRPCRGWY